MPSAMSYAAVMGEEPFGNTLVNALTGAEIKLAMQRLDLTGRATPAGALLRVTHQFKCEGTEPMEALYTFMLPRSGIVRRFVVKGEDFEVESKLSPREEARKEYEEGMAAGHLSVLAESNSDGMVTLSVGQVRPDETITVVIDIVAGVESKDKGFRFRFPFTLAPSYHAQAKATPTGAGGKIELPSDVFGDVILPEWKDDASGLHAVSFRLFVDAGRGIDSVASPSHRVLVRPGTDGTAEIELAGASDAPNRDLVVDVTCKEAVPALFSDDRLAGGTVGPDDPNVPANAPRWTAVVPSGLVPKAADIPRKVCFVLDCSGSMDGEPIQRGILAMKACLSALLPTDEFGLVRFGSGHVEFDKKMAPATDANRKRAAQFLGKGADMGGTELAGALAAAIDILGGPGDIFLATDGQVFGTGTIVEQIGCSGTRVHVLGIGSASQDRFLASLARRSGGVSRMLGLNEDIAAGALALFNAVRQPVRKDVKAFAVVGKKASQEIKVGTIWDGMPVVLTDLGTTGDAVPTAVTLQWGDGPKDKVKIPLPAPKATPNGLAALLWAGRTAEDLDSAWDMAGEGPARASIKQELLALSTKYGLATRVMSLGAVVKRAGDQPAEVKQQVVAVGTPEGMNSAGAFGGIARGLSLPAFTVNNLVGGGPQHVYAAMATSMSQPVRSRRDYSGPTKSFGGVRLAAMAPATSLRSKGFAPTHDCYTGDSGDETYDCCLSDDGMDMEIGCSADSFSEPSIVTSSAYIPDSSRGPAWKGPASTLGTGLESWLPGLKDDGGLDGPDMATRIVKTALLALLCHAKDHAPGKGFGDALVYAVHVFRMSLFLKGTGDPVALAVADFLVKDVAFKDIVRLEALLKVWTGPKAPFGDAPHVMTEVGNLVAAN